MFRAIFGVLGLLIVLAIVGSLAKNQLAALGQIGSSRTAKSQTPGAEPGRDTAAAGDAAMKAVGGARLQAFPGANAAEPLDAQAQIKGIQNDMRDRANQALQQGVERSNRAQP
jgi:hypothetical protein